MKVLFLTRYGRLGASSRLRSMQFIPFLQQHGIEAEVQELFSDELLALRYSRGSHSIVGTACAYARRIRAMLRCKRFDLVWIEKEALPWMPASLEKFLLSGVPYMLDFDDAVFHNYDRHRLALARILFGKRLDHLMAGAGLVTCGNEYLAARARAAGAPMVEWMPTVIDVDRYQQLYRPDGQLPSRIVWVGSPSTARYLHALAAPLAALAQRRAFSLRVIGGVVEMPGVNVECLPWTEATEASAIAECDIGIMPLEDSPWERGKCGYKLIQYMACGLAVVASPVGVNVDIVNSGVNGLLAQQADEWLAALERLLGDPVLCGEMGRAGRGMVEQTYSVQAVAPQMARLMRKIEKSKLCAD